MTILPCQLIPLSAKQEIYCSPTVSNSTGEKKKAGKATKADDATVMSEVSDTSKTNAKNGWWCAGITGLFEKACARVRSFVSVAKDVATDTDEDEEATKSLPAAFCKAVQHLPRFFQNDSWFDLACIFFLLTFGSLIVYMLIFFLPLAAHDAGLKANRGFVYLGLTYYQGLAWGSWLGTLKFVFPNKLFPFRKRFVVLAVVLASQKAADCFYVEFHSDWKGIFPIPFSLFYTAIHSFGIMNVLIMRYVMPVSKNPGRKYKYNKLIGKKFVTAIRLMYRLGFSQFVVCLWGIAMHQLADRPIWQFFVGLTCILLRFLCKTLLLYPVTSEMAYTRFMVLNMVVDVQFTRVQVATTPFIRSPLAFYLLVLAESAALLGSTFSLLERFGLLFKSSCFNNRASKLIKKEFGAGFQERAKNIFGATVKHVSWAYVRGQEDIEDRRRGWMDRAMFHFVDGIASRVISIIVRTNQLLCIIMVRALPANEHINETFQLSDDDWKKANWRGWGAVMCLLCSVLLVSHKRLHVLDQPDGRKASLNRILGYVFRKHFWFWFLWLVTTGAYVVAAMILHFGIDFTLEFDWMKHG